MELDNTNQKPKTHGPSSLLVSIAATDRNGLHGNNQINRNTDMIQLLFYNCTFKNNCW